MTSILAVNLQNHLLWAILIGWIISVILHEFAHGLVAYLGGDYTIRERGGLSLNPLQYVDPMFSIVFPAIILLMGGIPLPGGVTYIRRDLLRNKYWDSAVSLAGPAMNLLLFFVCAIPLHSRFGWVDHSAGVGNWTTAQIFLGAMAVLQFTAVILNMIPVPPLDGFQALSNFLPTDLRIKLSTPPISTAAFFVYFMVLWNGAFKYVLLVFVYAMLAMRFRGSGINNFLDAWAAAFQ